MPRRDADDDDAPWLAEAGGGSARGRERTNVSKRSVFWTVLVLLTMAAVIAVGLILLLSKKDGGSAQGYMNAEQAPLITAEPGPYKIAPADPKGMAVEGQDQTIYAAGEGIDPGSVIDQSAGPEAPLPRPGTAPAEAPAAPPPGPPRDIMPGSTPPAAAMPVPMVKPAVPPAAKPALAKPVVPPAAAVAPPPVAAPVAAKPKSAAQAAKLDPAAQAAKPDTTALAVKSDAAPAKKPGIVQLGAFSTPEKANDAWTRLAPKHGLSGKRVIAVEANGQTLYRLRASGDSAQICAKLKAAGDACAVVE